MVIACFFKKVSRYRNKFSNKHEQKYNKKGKYNYIISVALKKYFK